MESEHCRQAPAEKLTPEWQVRQVVGLEGEQVLQDESQGTHALLWRAYPALQVVQAEAELQIEQPLGQMIDWLPTMALEAVVEGLVTQRLEESRE